MTKLLMLSMLISSVVMSTIKSVKTMVMNFCLFLVTSSLLMAMVKKLTIIPFLLVLTILGGLMVLFMYMTTMGAEYKISKQNFIPPLLPMMLVFWFTENKMKKKFIYEDSSMELFNQNMLFMLTLMMILIVMTMIFIIMKCSVIKYPVRQKLNPWN